MTCELANHVDGARRTVIGGTFLRYTRDLSMRAQAKCPDDANPICLGYAVATLTSLVVNLELGK